MKELKRIKLRRASNSSVFKDHNGTFMLCRSDLLKFINLPPEVTRLELVITSEPTKCSYKIDSARHYSQNYRYRGTFSGHHTDLYIAFFHLIKQYLGEYIHVEYGPAR